MIDGNGQLIGIFTDGDLRRALEQQHDLSTTQVGSVMSWGAKTIDANALAAEAVTRMENDSISALIVVDEQNKITGVVPLLALLKAGIV